MRALAHVGAGVDVFRNDQISVEAVINRKPRALVLSPGPCAPEQAGICLDLLRANAALGSDCIPVLGVCLGHQAIAQAYGGRVIRARAPVHGKVRSVRHKGHAMFDGVPERFQVVRYHSLVAERESLPSVLEITAQSDDENDSGEIMALAHATQPVFGVQFHPESYAAEHGGTLFAVFLRRAGEI